MVLEAIEDHLRGWKGEQQALGGERVGRGNLHIEHVIPRKWQTNWPLTGGEQDEAGRDALIHTIGNLTLLTSKLNSKVSNGPWFGEHGKRQGVKGHDVLFLNKRVLDIAEERKGWSEATIRERTQELTEVIIEIWPVPPNHRSGFGQHKASRRKKIRLADLINAGALTPGPLFPRKKKYSDKVAAVLSDGQVEVDGVAYEGPSPAASAIVGKHMNGWWFFLVDQESNVHFVWSGEITSIPCGRCRG